MPRKRKPDQPTTEPDAATAALTAPAATAGPEPVKSPEEPPTLAERVGRKTDRAAVADPFGIAADYAAGVRLFESRRDRLMAIGFDDKPGQPVIDKLREAGYRWEPADKVWTHPVRPEAALGTRIEAERLFQEVRRMVRADKGVEPAPEIPF